MSSAVSSSALRTFFRCLYRVQRLPRVSIHDSSGLELSSLNLLGAHPEPVACERVRINAKCAKLVARERVRFRGSEAPVELFSGSKAAHKRPCVERIRRSEAAQQRTGGGNTTPVQRFRDVEPASAPGRNTTPVQRFRGSEAARRRPCGPVAETPRLCSVLAGPRQPENVPVAETQRLCSV